MCCSTSSFGDIERFEHHDLDDHEGATTTPRLCSRSFYLALIKPGKESAFASLSIVQHQRQKDKDSSKFYRICLASKEDATSTFSCISFEGCLFSSFFVG
jgi:hypothetical protein